MNNFFIDQDVLIVLALFWGGYLFVFQSVVTAMKSRARAKVSKLRLRQKNLESVWGKNLNTPS